jgi:hypothetical protein
MTFRVLQKIAVLQEYELGGTLELNIVQWFSNPPKFDLRYWMGEEPGRGMTLEYSSAEELCSALHLALEIYKDDVI